MRSVAWGSSFRLAYAVGACVLGLVTVTHAQIPAGPNSPGAVVSDGSFGSSSWAAPGNGLTSNEAWAQAAPAGLPTQYLKATNYGFALPGPAEIVGIEVNIERHCLGGTIHDERVRIVKGGVVGSTERALGATWPTGTDAVATYGGSSDLWGETWTPADINANGFGVALSVVDGADLALVDHMTITVYYSLCAATPTGGCRSAQKSILVVKDKSPDSKDKLVWKWIRGQSTSTSEFEDPVDLMGDTNYALCIYAGSASARIADMRVPPGFGWSNISTKGFKYLDNPGINGGIQKMILKANLDDKAKALVKGKGVNLPTIAPPLALPVTVQLVNSSTGVCWEGTYAAPDLKKNEAGTFKAKAD